MQTPNGWRQCQSDYENEQQDNDYEYIHQRKGCCKIYDLHEEDPYALDRDCRPMQDLRSIDPKRAEHIEKHVKAGIYRET